MITLVRTNGKQTLLSMCHIPEAFNIHCYCPNTLRARFMHQDNYYKTDASSTAEWNV